MKKLGLVALLAGGLCFWGCAGGGTRSGGDAGLGDTGPGSDAGADSTPPTGDGGVDGGPSDSATPDGGSCDVEICGNGLDDDCDGMIEETCPCLPGETASCFSGTAGERGVGACGDGTMVCTDGLEFGTWGACEGESAPAEELCGTDFVDEDCDGAIDEGCECVGDEPGPCGGDVGACSTGIQACIDGLRGACEGATGPLAEVCNGIDDDCDGLVDETISRRCGNDVGECAEGTQICIDGAWDVCAGGREPGVEVCDGADNNCDGVVDEGLMRACGSALGECRAGNQTCDAGAWSSCTGETLPMLETCDGLDNNCDGAADEGISRGCGTDVGVCRSGTETCSAGSFGACAGDIGAGTEACDGVLDEDCDGAVDEGCGCTSGATRGCGTSTGLCVAGTQTCVSGGWESCVGATGPVLEDCNMLDDDCDGATDEGGICPTSPPIAVCPADITAEVLSTVALSGSGSDPDGGTVTYSWTVTTRPGGSISNPVPPDAASTGLRLDAAGDFTLELCVMDDEGESDCCTVAIVSTAPGALHVEMNWDTVYGDVDLHLLNVTRVPDDGWFTSDDTYWSNRAPDWGPAGAVANPTLDIDDTDGFGPENITIDLDPASGEYNVAVHYFCERSIGRGDIGAGSGPTDATVRVFCDGALIATYTDITLDGTDDWVHVAGVTYPGCVGRSVNRANNGSSLLPASFTAARHCETSCGVDADCPDGERCATVGGGGPPRRACVLDR